MTDIQITGQGRQLTWRFRERDEQGFPEKYSHFEIYAAEEPYLVSYQGAKRIAESRWPIFQLDNLRQLGPFSSPQFLWVVAVDEFGNRSRGSPAVARAAFRTKARASGGSQLLPWWFEHSEIRTAAQWLAAVPAIDAIARWEVAGQRWQVLARDDSTGDFELQAGQVYRLQAWRDTTVVLYGRVPEHLQFRLQTGENKNNNLIWIPFDKSELQWASDLARDIGSEVELVSIWNARSQSWRSYLPGLPFTDFRIRPGWPVMVSVKAPVVWPWRPAEMLQPQPIHGQKP
ncbi:MAG: hypothetical protein Q9P14_03250 [candidate division KSB1 bacterium]|nr:hypothetical protein [candidate division KSB1 bacterium]